jgi:hypothetical protein
MKFETQHIYKLFFEFIIKIVKIVRIAIDDPPFKIFRIINNSVIRYIVV